MANRHPRLADLHKDPVSDFGQRVKVLLVSYGWTQRDLAETLGITPQSVSNMLRSRWPKLETVEKLAAILKTDPHRLDVSYRRRKADAIGEERRIAARAKRREEAIRRVQQGGAG